MESGEIGCVDKNKQTKKAREEKGKTHVKKTWEALCSVPHQLEVHMMHFSPSAACFSMVGAHPARTVNVKNK